ncbi:hypothetical protein BDW67DRAFT_160988 [Aspergillus spinulosporus]
MSWSLNLGGAVLFLLYSAECSFYAGDNATDESIKSVASTDWRVPPYMYELRASRQRERSVLPYGCDSSPRKRVPDSTLGVCKGRWIQARLRVREDPRFQGLASFSTEGCSPNGDKSRWQARITSW